ncbi:Ultraviolet-B receptor UVR8 [Galdieria sulphuraria]|nr:Ultraviolet-B receptor UVR8 [Galdieria sulphuraria]
MHSVWTVNGDLSDKDQHFLLVIEYYFSGKLYHCWFLIVSGCFALFTSSTLCVEMQLKSSWEQLLEERKNRMKKAALENGTLLTTFGLNLIGQLGQGHERPADRPFPVEALSGKRIVYVAAGDSCTAAISLDGDVYTWGSGEYGKLGHNDDSNENLPRLVEALKGKNIVKVSIGGNHMAAIDKDGHLYCWGRAASAGSGGTEHVFIPRLIKGDLEKEKVISVSCGRSHTAAVTEKGEVWTWGNGYEGELGHGEKNSQYQPKKVQSLTEKVVDVACGRDFTIFVCESGLYSCGADDYGQLGLGRSHGERFVQTPRSLSGTGLSDVVAISAGREGQLGHGEKADCSLAKPVDNLRNFEIVQVACGGGHTAAVTKDGVLYTWGRGRDGQLGRGGELESIASYRTSPVQVTSLPAGAVLYVTLGSDHSAVLCQDMKNKNG